MGILRLTLALSVIVAHVGPIAGIRFFGGGVMAVETFYMLSGFYVALILSERYRSKHGLFYFNRACRLIPIYWMLLCGFFGFAIIYWLITGRPMGALGPWIENHNRWYTAWAAFSNFSMLGCDWAELYANLYPSKTSNIDDLIVMQATWSLSVEILFYALSPFILNQRKSTQAGIFIIALLIRLMIWKITGEHWTPWTYYFAPASWVFFMGGVLSYHLMIALDQWPLFRHYAKIAGYGLVAMLCVIICFYTQLDILTFQDWRFYLLVAVSMPFIFTAFRSSAIDNHIASWSYPSYLAHTVVLSLYAPLRHFISENNKIYAVIVLTGLWVAPLLYFDSKIQARFKKAA